MYLIEGTIEKAIYDLSVQRRLAHIGNKSKGKFKKNTSKASELDEDVQAVDAAEMQDKPLARVLKKGSEGGEIVGKDDLWTCLFGNSHARRELPNFVGNEHDDITVMADNYQPA
jgi:E3 ubiquitin-protein ligase SHPRH